ncbi:apoptosis-inducing TAF9-like domain 1 family protein [Tothia fuscella]|uniref:Apoptosis-inducing TAF9-like domain 1 family protein n=1 Tax=Tothia fuscella TaxID=1048955 RepID=A0A9P4NJG1_9PEZI|nr:apoptosis-inducing TAF9-like domain 1 family protein [Tothia fuscella]
MATNDVNDNEEALKSALWYSIGRLTDETTLAQDTNATPQFIGALMELVWQQIRLSARDLETFAKHAGRRQINVDDVLLLARRNEGLEVLLRGFVEDLEGEKKGKGSKGKGRAKGGR